MIVVAIVGILAAIALPAYTSYMQRGDRAAVKTVLLEAAQLMERYRSANFSYVDSLDNVPDLPDRLKVSPSQGAKRYDVVVSAPPDGTSFILTATPSGWSDSVCGSLTLTNLGVKSQTLFPSPDAKEPATTASCWNK